MPRVRKLRFDASTAASRSRHATVESVRALQVAIYVMCGGGMIGRFGAEQPLDFYIDDRVGRLPYSRQAIYNAVGALIQEARLVGIDPAKIGRMPDFHNCGCL